MIVYFLAFLFTLLTVAAMAIGVIVQGKRIRGSCGGIQCSACAHHDTCGRQRAGRQTVVTDEVIRDV